jgi:hypothetical protein
MNNRRSFDWESITACARGVDRAAFKVTFLIVLFGFSVGPIFHSDLTARVLGAAASAVLAVLAAVLMFRARD